MTRQTPHPLDGPALRTAATVAERKAGLARLSAPRPKIRKGPKNHSNNRERSRKDAAKAAKHKRLHNEAQREWRRKKAIIRAYWRGEREDLQGAM